jgi:hypothetical protein
MSRNDLPNPNATNFGARMREAMMTYLGRLGDPLDRGLTLRDLVEAGMVRLREGFTLRSGFSGTLPIEPGSAISEAYERDLTPPPTPTGFAVSSAISHVFIEHDTPAYQQGHGHLRTRVYGKVVAAGDALPVFADAAEVTQFSGRTHAHPSNPATTWRLWIKWETVDGVLSTNPAGGTNGLEVTTGQDVAKLLESISQYALDPDVDDPSARVVYRADTFAVAPRVTFNQEATPTATVAGDLWYQPSTGVTKAWDGAAWVAFSTAAPFVVNTQPQTINGVAVPPGVFMDAAFIKNGTITDAKIGNLRADKITAGYTSSVDLESGVFFGSDFYIGGTATYEYNDPVDPARKTGIASVSNPAIALKGGDTPTAEFTVDAFKVKTSTSAAAIPLLTVSGTTVRINFNELSNTLSDLGYTGDSDATRNKVWQQTTAPTSGVADGDLWFDTNDNNRLYVRTSGSWVLRRDTGIDAALSAASTAQDTADGKIESFYQTSAPTSGMSLGDLWFDTDDGNKLYRYNGSAWVAAQDSKIGQAISDAATAQATADGKIITFFGDSTPTASAVGDLWYSDSTKLLKRWSGSSWVTVSSEGAPSGTNVGSTLAQTVESNAANGDSAYSAVNNASTGLATKLANNARNALSGPAGLAIGSIDWNTSGVRTSGYGVGITANGIAAYNSSGDVTFTLSGSTGAAIFAGALSAATGTFAGSINGGAFTGYAWPSGGTPSAPKFGFYLGSEGLLLGNYETVFGVAPSTYRKYLQVTSAGDIYSSGFSVVNGNLSIGGGKFAAYIDGSVVADNVDIRRRIVLQNGEYDGQEVVIGSYADEFGSSYYPVGSVFNVEIQSLILTDIYDADTQSALNNQPYYVAARGSGAFRNWSGGSGSTFKIAVTGDVGVTRSFSNSGNYADDHRIAIRLRMKIRLDSGYFNTFRIPVIKWTLFKL